MKRYIAVVLVVWLASAFLLLFYTPTADRSYMTDVNRLHEKVTLDIKNGTELPTPDTDSIQSFEVVYMNQMTAEQVRFFFAVTAKNTVVILPIENPDAFVRYTIKPQNRSRVPTLVLVSFAPLIALFALIKIEADVLKPFRVMSGIPAQLAKGHYHATTPQLKRKVFHSFLWGLDMLRTKLDEQKDINISLEKERKTLVASLSHDIKTPLSSIKNYSSAIRDGIYSTPEEVRSALDIIAEKTAKIERLTDDLLASSVNAIKEISVDVTAHYLSELRDAINKTVQNRLNLLKMEHTINPIPSNVLVLVDLDRLVEVCDNIIENAVKYGDLGSLNVNFSSEEQHVLISFENTGQHIPDAEIKHIFTSFYRGSNVGKAQGHGLGLYISKHIMRAMGGDIYAENTDVAVRFTLIVKQG